MRGFCIVVLEPLKGVLVRGEQTAIREPNKNYEASAEISLGYNVVEGTDFSVGQRSGVDPNVIDIASEVPIAKLQYAERGVRVGDRNISQVFSLHDLRTVKVNPYFILSASRTLA